MVQLLGYLPQVRAPDLPDVGNALNRLGEGVEYFRNEAKTARAYQDAQEQKRYARGRAAAGDGDERKKAFGQAALKLSGMPDDDPMKGKIWESLLKRSGSSDLTPEQLDFRTGPKLMAAEAGLFNDPYEQEERKLKLDKLRREASGRADGKTYEVDGRLVEVQPGGGVREIYSAPEKPDPIKDMLMRRLQDQGQGGLPAPPGGQQQAPMLQPQSFQQPAARNNPLLQLAAERVADQPQAAPSLPEVEGSGMIDTPYGPMTRQDAQQMGGAMLLDPRYQAAGKQLLDSLAAGKGQLSKPAETQLDERTISAASTLGRLQSIKRQFKPEFQQIPTQLKLLGASWGASFGGRLSPQLQQQLGEFAQYKATAFDNFNQLLKELSGTAVSAQELQRQQLVQPNPGQGPLGGDDPVTFQAKIEAGERIAKAAIARMNYMRNRGVQFNKDTAERFLRLEDVPAAIDRRGAEIEEELRRTNPQADPMSIEREAMNRVKQEFGI